MAKVTIILPVSRITFLSRIFAQLELMPCDMENTNLITLVDGNQQVLDVANNYTMQSKFKIKKCISRRKGIPSTGHVRMRRQRIADIHNEFKQWVQSTNCDYVFSLEDDTLFPLNTMQKLLMAYIQYPHAGFISGLELGRWGWCSIGAYTVNDVYNPAELISIDPDLVLDRNLVIPEIQEVDAAGLYGCLIKKQLYLNHDFTTFSNGAMGPDVELGLDLRRQGYKNYVDLSLKYAHLTVKGEITFLNSDIVRVKVSNKDGKWTQEII